MSVRDEIRENIERRAAELTGQPMIEESTARQFFTETGPAFAAETIKQGAIPAALAAGGTALGALAGPAAPLAVPLLGAAGGMAGLQINRMLGISEPTTFDMALEAAAPMAGRVGRFIKEAIPARSRGVKFLTRLAQAETEELFRKEEQALIATLAARGKETRGLPVGKVATDELYVEAAREIWKDAAGLGVKIPMPNTAAWIDQEISHLKTLSNPPAAVQRYLRNLKSKIELNGGTIAPHEVVDEINLANASIGATQRRGGIDLGAYKKLRLEIEKDLSTAVDNPQLGLFASTSKAGNAAEMVQFGRRLMLRGYTLNDLAVGMQRAAKFRKGKGEEGIELNVAGLLNELKDTREGKLGWFFSKAFDATERKEITDLLKRMNKIPDLPPGAGQMFGSGQVMMQAGSLGAGGFALGTLGEAVGLPITARGMASLGIGAGLGLPPVFNSIKVVSEALHYKTGRALLRNLLTEQGTLSSTGLDVLMAFVAAQHADPANAVE